MSKEYLGDSVYADFKDGELIVTTENGYGPSNTIVFEPEVFAELVRFVKRHSAKAEPVEVNPLETS